MITHHGTKTGIGSEHIRPKAAFINPERFSTLPAIHISAGVCDMLSHICERYFSNTAATDFVDGQAEAALRTIIKFGPKVLADLRTMTPGARFGRGRLICPQRHLRSWT